MRIVVIGAGPGGICMGVRLLQAGLTDFTVLEAAPGLGGTWWHNRYPGAACDVPSDLYSFSFALKTDWSRPYAPRQEIQAYLRACADSYGVTEHIRYGAAVHTLRWDDGGHRWRVVLAGGEELSADVVVSAVGMFNEPRWPEIDGLDTFAGTVVHAARWPSDLQLGGRDVAVIGSAASAVQLIPHVAAQAKTLTVFQRTANWVLPKDDDPYSAEEVAGSRADPLVVRQRRWKTWRALERFTAFDDPRLSGQLEALGHQNLERVDDPDLRGRLTPDAPFGCKRPLFSNDYYPTFNRPNVRLARGAARQMRADAVTDADGQAYPADVVVAATGFHTTRFLSTIAVTGRDGTTLADAWADGAQAYLGMTVPGFPNLFQLYGPNTNQGSILFMLECQSGYIARHVRRMQTARIATLEVREDVAARYNDRLQADLQRVAVWQIDCNHYYRAPSGRIVTQYPYPMADYRSKTAVDDADSYVVTVRPPLGEDAVSEEAVAEG